MRRRRYLAGLGVGAPHLLPTVAASPGERGRGRQSGSSDLSVSIERVDDPVRAGDVLTVGIGLENVGDEPSSQELRLVVCDEVVDAESVTIPGNTRWPVPIRLSYETCPGRRDVSVPFAVEWADDATRRTADVVAAADGDLAVEFFSVDDPVASGDVRRVRVRVENTGTVTQTQEVRLLADGDVVARETVTVVENEARSFGLSYETAPIERDVTVSLTVETEDDADRRSVERLGRRG